MTATMVDLDRRIEEIKKRPYQRELIPEDDGTWFVRIAEFPGCMSAGDTPAEAMTMIDDAMTGWLRVLLEDGDPIPEPFTEEAFSGKTMVRLGKALHRDATAAAERDGVSLNHFIVTAVARAAGSRASA